MKRKSYNYGTCKGSGGSICIGTNVLDIVHKYSCIFVSFEKNMPVYLLATEACIKIGKENVSM